MLIKIILIHALVWLFMQPHTIWASQGNPAESLDSLSNALIVVGVCSVICSCIYGTSIVKSAKLKYLKGKQCPSKSSNTSL